MILNGVNVFLLFFSYLHFGAKNTRTFFAQIHLECSARSRSRIEHTGFDINNELCQETSIPPLEQVLQTIASTCKEFLYYVKLNLHHSFAPTCSISSRVFKWTNLNYTYKRGAYLSTLYLSSVLLVQCVSTWQYVLIIPLLRSTWPVFITLNSLHLSTHCVKKRL